MKKKFCLFFFLFAMLKGNAQDVSGIIKYRVEILHDEQIEKSTLKQYYDKARTSQEKIGLTLVFVNGASLFTIDPVMNPDNDLGMDLAKTWALGCENLYFDSKTKGILKQIDNHLGVYIISESFDCEWELSSETKIIDGYKCYKATTTYRYLVGDRIASYPVEAWYCPSVPAPFGPNGFGNLPGLIFELRERFVAYSISGFTLNPEDPVKVKIPSKGKIITQKEYNKIADDFSPE